MPLDADDTIPDLKRYHPTIEIDEETWEAIAEHARCVCEHADVDPVVAYHDAVHDHMEIVPELVVDDERRAVDDIDALGSDGDE